VWKGQSRGIIVLQEDFADEKAPDSNGLIVLKKMIENEYALNVAPV
jgi:hypothetical protein